MESCSFHLNPHFQAWSSGVYSACEFILGDCGGTCPIFNCC